MDFPAPDGPNIAVNSPDLNCPQIPLNITFVPKTYENRAFHYFTMLYKKNAKLTDTLSRWKIDESFMCNFLIVSEDKQVV